ncbi:TPA: hypothetical protein ACGPBJ_001988 [Streptococcus suis]
MANNNKPFFTEFIDRLREDHQMRLDDEYYRGFFQSLELATAAMIEAGLDRKQITELLIKYWDLRPSEARSLIEINPARLDD